MINIKARIIKKIILVSSDPEKSYILKTDASDYAMRGILKQKVDKKIYPVILFSKVHGRWI